MINIEHIMSLQSFGFRHINQQDPTFEGITKKLNFMIDNTEHYCMPLIMSLGDCDGITRYIVIDNNGLHMLGYSGSECIVNHRIASIDPDLCTIVSLSAQPKKHKLRVYYHKYSNYRFTDIQCDEIGVLVRIAHAAGFHFVDDKLRYDSILNAEVLKSIIKEYANPDVIDVEFHNVKK